MNLKNTPHKASSTLWSTLILILLPSTFYIMYTGKTIIIQWDIMSMNSTHIMFPIIIDPIGLVFSSIVVLISANVMHFSKSYMSGDMFITRFTHLVLLFILSMNMLIFIPHMMCLLLGWDGLGITSFILVIYYQTPKSLAAGMITALTNRIGDVMILLSIAWTLNQGQWNILNMWNNSSSQIIALLIMLAAMTKSAQMPFSSWLPAAMAAPTPVSALVHSSTLVTAGVFLLIRFYPTLHSTPFFNTSMLFMASLTMFMAGLSAMMECDMKKIIALSTLSQLGVMMASLGLNLPSLALFHLLTHALFKALLFMCAGSLINLLNHNQDLRSMGNLSKQTPAIMSSMLIANMALCGSPFLAGFYSKDMILEMSTFQQTNSLILSILFLSTALTSAYTARLMLTLAMGPSLSTPLHSVNDKDKDITFPTMTMTIGAIMGGALMNWLFFLPSQEPFLNENLKFAALISTALGLALASSITMEKNKSPLPSAPTLNHMMSSMWFLTFISSQMMIKWPLKTSHHLLKIMDQGWNEITGGQGILSMTSSQSKKTQLWQNNMITTHLTLMMMISLPILMMMP